jgi:hypothetical protein
MAEGPRLIADCATPVPYETSDEPERVLGRLGRGSAPVRSTSDGGEVRGLPLPLHLGADVVPDLLEHQSCDPLDEVVLRRGGHAAGVERDADPVGAGRNLRSLRVILLERLDEDAFGVRHRLTDEPGLDAAVDGPEREEQTGPASFAGATVGVVVAQGAEVRDVDGAQSGQRVPPGGVSYCKLLVDN